MVINPLLNGMIHQGNEGTSVTAVSGGETRKGRPWRQGLQGPLLKGDIFWGAHGVLMDTP